jgi:hypothetical protein
LDYILRPCFKNTKKQNKARARRRWLTPVILAIQEAEIRRIEVRSQPRQTVRKTLSQKTLHKTALVEWLKV